MKSSFKKVGYPYTIQVTIVLMDIPCQPLLQLHRALTYVTLLVSSPPAAYIAPSGVKKVGSFLISTNLITPSPVTKMYSYCLQQQSFDIKLWQATKSSGNSLYCFGGTWDTCDQQLKARYSRPGSGLSCGVLWLLGGLLSVASI